MHKLIYNMCRPLTFSAVYRKIFSYHTIIPIGFYSTSYVYNVCTSRLIQYYYYLQYAYVLVYEPRRVVKKQIYVLEGGGMTILLLSVNTLISQRIRNDYLQYIQKPYNYDGRFVNEFRPLGVFVIYIVCDVVMFRCARASECMSVCTCAHV